MLKSKPGGASPPVRTALSLQGLVPPADYTDPVGLSPPRGAFVLLAEEDTLGVVGRVLGSGAEAVARWKHLASDAAAAEAVKGSVMLNHIAPLPEWKSVGHPEARVRLAYRLGGQFLKPSGSEALLVHGTAGWDVCVRLARHLAQRDGEADDEYASRCRRHQAWAATHAFEKAGIILLILRQAAALLSGFDLFEGMPGYSLAFLSPAAPGAHLRVPARLCLEGRLLERLIDPGWRRPPGEGGGGSNGNGNGGGSDGNGGGRDGKTAAGGDGGGEGVAPPATSTAAGPRETGAVDVSAEAGARSEVAEQLNTGSAAAQANRQSDGGGATAEVTDNDDGASDSARSAASTHAAANAQVRVADALDPAPSAANTTGDVNARLAYELAEAVRGIVYRGADVTLDEMCERLATLGLRADKRRVEEELSKAKRERAARRAEVAVDDAVEAFNSDLAVWMRANGVRDPSGKEAARLRLLSDRLVEQRSKDDFDGAVATWLETRLGSSLKPTRNERNVAARKVQAFFAQGSTSELGGAAQGRTSGVRVRRAR